MSCFEHSEGYRYDIYSQVHNAPCMATDVIEPIFQCESSYPFFHVIGRFNARDVNVVSEVKAVPIRL